MSNARGSNQAILMAITTLGARADAEALVKLLVEQRVIACGTILGGATSHYRWDGQANAETEVLVLLKTTVGRWPDLERSIEQHHPYDVPELIAFPTEMVSTAYLRWVHQETQPLESGQP